MRKILLGAVLALVIVFGIRYCEHQKDEREQLEASTALIQTQLQNVGKLVVTEGNYAQVFSYNDSKDLLYGLVKAYKKALVIIDAKAKVSYDLSKMVVTTNAEKKKVIILFIPEPELDINPNIKYYDVSQDYLNQFTERDFNIVKERIEDDLHRKISKSELMTNAENRLISELQKIYILTNSMGWTLEYDATPINSSEELQRIKL
ncbi:DUF4230 domain-containing protein [Croceibacter atlanticus]|uniref:DUF4230 domain-containing protein n=1 Tax=Croceibacter atlanticus TaxID=313588 RepID=UPI0030D87335|tara:strand:- start:81834 stop:82448 length:615 start_codon:yes stop_codon:yes gene_type:complete